MQNSTLKSTRLEDAGIDRILSALDAKQNGNGWSARCPAHEDRRASLSIAVGDDGRILMRCHAGCETKAIVEKLGLNMKDLMPSNNGSATKKNKTRIKEIANFEIVTDGALKKIRVPLSMDQIIATANAITDEWPRRIDSSIFVHDKKYGVGWLNNPAALFGYYQRTAGRVRWIAGESMVKQAEVFAELQRTSKKYVAVESLPHEPYMPNYYYACDPIQPGDGMALLNLLDRFNPSTDIDRDLIQAALMTPMWGGPCGARPCFVITSDDGRGSGKTTLAEITGEIYGGCLNFSHMEDIGKIKTRLLSPDAMNRRVALLDNVKTPKFSWGELESMITASSIGGHRMYCGEAVRPNTLTWFITLNGAALSSDMAQRSIIIKISKPKRSATWQEAIKRFINENRRQILGDIIGALRAPIFPLEQFTRWASWERDVLQRLPEPADAQATIGERQASVDADMEEADLIGDYFADQLGNLGYDSTHSKVFIPSSVAARWFGWATGQKKTTAAAATRALKQLSAEGRLPRITPNYCNSWGRGFIWTGSLAEITATVSIDLNCRISEQYRDG